MKKRIQGTVAVFLVLPHLFGGIVMIDAPFVCYLLSFKRVGCWV